MFFTKEMKWSNFPRNKNTPLFASKINDSTQRLVHIFGALENLAFHVKSSRG
jgi:hypothetical protein